MLASASNPSVQRPRVRLRRHDAYVRLAFWLPLTPWPVLRALRATGPYGSGTLGSVGGYAAMALMAATAVGFILLWRFANRDKEFVSAIWFFFAIINYFVMWDFIENGAAVYAK